MLWDKVSGFSRLQSISFCWVQDTLMSWDISIITFLYNPLLQRFICLCPKSAPIAHSCMTLKQSSIKTGKVGEAGLFKVSSGLSTQGPSAHWTERCIWTFSELYDGYIIPGSVPCWTFTLLWLLHLTSDLSCHQTSLVIAGPLSRRGYTHWTRCVLIQVLRV